MTLRKTRSISNNCHCREAWELTAAKAVTVCRPQRETSNGVLLYNCWTIESQAIHGSVGFGEFCEDKSLGWILEVVSTPAAKQ